MRTRLPPIYLGAIASTGTAKSSHKKILKHGGEFALVALEVAPRNFGDGLSISHCYAASSIPSRFAAGINRGINKASREGLLGGHPIKDLSVTVVDGAFHEMDSTPASFEAAAWVATREALKKAQPYLLEAIMHVVVEAPAKSEDKLRANLAGRRAKSLEAQELVDLVRVTALVPLAEMNDFFVFLNTEWSGTATYRMEVHSYARIDINPEDPNFPGAKGVHA